MYAEMDRCAIKSAGANSRNRVTTARCLSEHRRRRRGTSTKIERRAPSCSNTTLANLKCRAKREQVFINLIHHRVIAAVARP